jgi:hypothetical protein
VAELMKMLPDGASAIAVIVVVMLFLKQQERLNVMLETITRGFNDQVYDSQKTFQEQVLRLTRQQCENQKLYQDQIQSLIDAHIKVSRETILALKSLEASLKEARDHGHIKVVAGG